jgi:phosphate starvation-inducible PhoH-like protein
LKENSTNPQSEIILTFENTDPVQLFGENNIRFNLLKDAFPEVSLTSRGNNLKIVGEKKIAQRVKDKVEWMVRLLKEFKYDNFFICFCPFLVNS